MLEVNLSFHRAFSFSICVGTFGASLHTTQDSWHVTHEFYIRDKIYFIKLLTSSQKISKLDFCAFTVLTHLIPISNGFPSFSLVTCEIKLAVSGHPQSSGQLSKVFRLMLQIESISLVWNAWAPSIRKPTWMWQLDLNILLLLCVFEMKIRQS